MLPHWERPWTNFGVEAAHPVRKPGPASLLNEPFDMAFPKSVGPGIGERVASISDNLGSRAALRLEGDGSTVVLDEEGEGTGHWRRS